MNHSKHCVFRPKGDFYWTLVALTPNAVALETWWDFGFRLFSDLSKGVEEDLMKVKHNSDSMGTVNFTGLAKTAWEASERIMPTPGAAWKWQWRGGGGSTWSWSKVLLLFPRWGLQGDVIQGSPWLSFYASPQPWLCHIFLYIFKER